MIKDKVVAHKYQVKIISKQSNTIQILIQVKLKNQKLIQQEKVTGTKNKK